MKLTDKFKIEYPDCSEVDFITLGDFFRKFRHKTPEWRRSFLNLVRTQGSGYTDIGVRYILLNRS